MLGLFFAGLLLLATQAVAAPAADATISQSTFNTLDMYMKYASSAYAASCPSPLGNTLIATYDNAATSTQGFLARDDTRKELVLALRGSQQIQDFLQDAEITPIAYVSPGVTPPAGATIHMGFLTAWNSIASNVIGDVRSQLAGPAKGYALRTSGHSLGAALSSLAAVSLKSNFPSSQTTMFTYGQPRTGNAVYASFVNNMFGTNAFRSVHTTDGVPTILPEGMPFVHHAFEYWNFVDPASPANIKMCSASGEDPSCSDSIPSMGIDAAHLTYFGRAADTPFCT